MTKKLLAIIIGLTLIMSAFTACGQKTDKQDSEESTQTAKEAVQTEEQDDGITATAEGMTYHDLMINIPDAVGNTVADDQLNVAIDGYMINIFYLENGGTMTDSNKSLHKYIEGFGGTVDETTEVTMNGTKVGVATYTKDGRKAKLYLFTLNNKNAYAICSTDHTSDDADNAKSIEVLDNAMEKITWENK